MKKIFVAVLFLAHWASLFAQDDAARVMTYNIRCGSCEDTKDVNHWSKRKFLVVAVIKRLNPDLIGLQEAELFQVNDLVELLGDYAWIGVGRDDGKEKGEMNAILFKKPKFELVTQKTLWLSETPGQVSRGWDAAYNRTVTIAKLKNKNSMKEFYFLNTHFDNLGKRARNESSRFIARTIDELNGQLPVILTGDLNSTPDFEGYRTIAAKLRDTHDISETRPEGGGTTFNGFGKTVQSNNKIDYIFVSGNLNVKSHKVIADLYNGLYPSDHYPVVVELAKVSQPRNR